MKTQRFNLRLVEKRDNQEIYNILTDENVIANLNLEMPKSILDVDNLIDDYLEGYQNNTKEAWAIIDKETNDFVGVFLLKLDLYNESSFESTVYLKNRWQNKGITTEIMPLMIKEVFDKFKVQNFRGYVMEKNKASARVLEKCGFTLEKIFKVPNIPGNILSYVIKNY